MRCVRVDKAYLRRHSAALPAIALGVQRVMRTAYERIFEEPSSASPFKRGTVRRELFDETREERVAYQIERLKYFVLQRDAVYVLGQARGEVVGLAKVSPLSSAGPGFAESPDCYLNDIAVETVRCGVGSRLLKAAVSQYNSDRNVVLDAFVGNDAANDWFERLGFSYVDEQNHTHGFSLGGVVVPQLRMTATVERVLQSLERRFP